MAQRTVKLYGKVWGNPAVPASITVSFGGVQRYQGPVTTVDGPIDVHCDFSNMIVMATWNIDLAMVGPNDFSFTVSGGDAIFHTMHGNYMGQLLISKFTSGAVWPAFQPSSANEVNADSQSLDDAVFDSKYALTKAEALVQIELDQIVPTDENWSDLSGPSTIESDGHDNVEINGVTQYRHATIETTGKWIYSVMDAQTLTCQVQTLPAVQ